MSFIRNGQVESAIAKCRLLFPGVAPPIEQIKVDQEEEGKPVNPFDPISVSFQLHCLQFIELVRNNKPTEALTYAQEYLSEFGKKRSVFLEPLRVSLLIFFWCKLSLVLGSCCIDRVSESREITNRAFFITGA
jgi:hypothetical protein